MPPLLVIPEAVNAGVGASITAASGCMDESNAIEVGGVAAISSLNPEAAGNTASRYCVLSTQAKRQRFFTIFPAGDGVRSLDSQISSAKACAALRCATVERQTRSPRHRPRGRAAFMPADERIIAQRMQRVRSKVGRVGSRGRVSCLERLRLDDIEGRKRRLVLADPRAGRACTRPYASWAATPARAFVPEGVGGRDPAQGCCGTAQETVMNHGGRSAVERRRGSA